MIIMIYRSKDGDVIDDLCYQVYADSRLTPEIYNANPNLASLGPVLPGGLEITLPDELQLETPTKLPKTNLFD